jgi:hypothetical protein
MALCVWFVVIELDEPIGRCIAAMDVIDARSLRQTPDTTNAKYVGILQIDVLNFPHANGMSAWL